MRLPRVAALTARCIIHTLADDSPTRAALSTPPSPRPSLSRYQRRERRHATRVAQEIERRGGACEVCRRTGPRHHFQWAHVEPVRNDRKARMRMLACASNTQFAAEVSRTRWLCLLCHADETVAQRAAGWKSLSTRPLYWVAPHARASDEPTTNPAELSTTSSAS